MDDLTDRVQQLEDRVAISEVVIRYCLNVDRKDWISFAQCFTDPLLTDFHLGQATSSTSREQFVSRVAEALDGFDLTQHLSTNHVITFDSEDRDAAVCTSAMYAQHQLVNSPNGDYYLLRAIYTTYMRRTSDGWRIQGISTERRWEDGNLTAVQEAIQRTEERRSPPAGLSDDEGRRR